MIAGGCGRGWGPHHAYKTGKKKAKIDKMSSFMIQKYAANRVFEGLDGSSKSLFAAERAMSLGTCRDKRCGVRARAQQHLVTPASSSDEVISSLTTHTTY